MPTLLNNFKNVAIRYDYPAAQGLDLDEDIQEEDENLEEAQLDLDDDIHEADDENHDHFDDIDFDVDFEEFVVLLENILEVEGAPEEEDEGNGVVID
ncbi:hypothetical protein COLO4_07084 [Corchorus olitorius]|uniref:Uncharacterized protein n=1 Tax=Corchorus olitorius TaxID=93759 RepID=A0A1R3KKZ1_9ROSI|nr:hypothetical protein COLO4_07084 [Corchorus olitorius]